MQKTTNKRNVTIAMMIATFLSSIEGTIVSTAMPVIVTDLGGLQFMSWVVSIYLLTTAVSTPVYGKMADLYGRKKIFVIGALIFLAGSMLSGISQTMWQLILFRAIQGLGAGAILPLTFTIIGDIYPYEQRAKVQGWISGIWGISAIIGPLTGGMLVDLVSWRWVFYMNLPFGVISLLLLWVSLHEKFERKKPKIDYAGVITFTISMTSLMYVLIVAGNEYAWGSFHVISLLVVAFIFFISFIWFQTRAEDPMLPLHLFKIRTIIVSTAVGFLISMALISVSFYIPLWVQKVYGKGATNSGMTLIPMSILWPVGAAIVGKYLVKVGTRWIVFGGTLFVLIGSIGLSNVHVATEQWTILLWTASFGIGFGLLFTSLTVAIQSSVPWGVRATAMSSNTFVRTLGQMVGIIFSGMLFNYGILKYIKEKSLDMTVGELNEVLTPDSAAALDMVQMAQQGIAFGFRSVFTVLAFVAIIASVITWILPRRGHEQTVEDGDSMARA